MRFTSTVEPKMCVPRSIRSARGMCALIALLFAGLRVTQAHPVAQGSMEIEIFPDKIHAQARVSMEEVFVQNALSTDAKDVNVALDELCRRHGDYLVQHLHFFADGKPIAGRVTRVTKPQGSGLQRAL